MQATMTTQFSPQLNTAESKIFQMGRKPRAYIFGAGGSGRKLLPKILERYEVLGFVDNKASQHKRQEMIGDYPIQSPEILKNVCFDRVVIAVLAGLEQVTEQLISYGLGYASIDRSFVEISVKSRILFLERLSEMLKQSEIKGSVAEGGVFQGEFAKEINRVFPEKVFYLFDTFEGFSPKDVATELESNFSAQQAGHFGITSIDLVKDKLPHLDMCVFKKGYFPETTIDVEDTFCFVNLDFDLYNPTLAGIEFFYPRMVAGGVILIHDYFSETYKGVAQAIDDYSMKGKSLKVLPIGDDCSVAVMC